MSQDAESMVKMNADTSPRRGSSPSTLSGEESAHGHSAGQDTQGVVEASNERQPVATRLAGPPHRQYVIVVDTMRKCGVCNQPCVVDSEMYKCDGCAEHICRDCVEKKLAEEASGVPWVWSGEEHEPFKLVYVQRKSRAVGEFGEGSWTGIVQVQESGAVALVELRAETSTPLSEEPSGTIPLTDASSTTVTTPVAGSSTGSGAPGGRPRFPRPNSALLRVNAVLRMQAQARQAWRQGVTGEPNQQSFAANIPLRLSPADSSHNNNQIVSQLASGTTTTAPTDRTLAAIVESSQDRPRETSRSASPDSQATIEDPDLTTEDVEFLSSRDLTITTNYTAHPPPAATTTQLPPVGIFTPSKKTAVKNSSTMAHNQGNQPTTPTRATQRVLAIANSAPPAHATLPPFLPRMPTMHTTIPARPIINHHQPHQPAHPIDLPDARATYTGEIITPGLSAPLTPRYLITHDPRTGTMFCIPIVAETQLAHVGLGDRYMTYRRYTDSAVDEVIHTTTADFLADVQAAQQQDVAEEPRTPEPAPASESPVSSKRKRSNREEVEGGLEETPTKKGRK